MPIGKADPLAAGGTESPVLTQAFHELLAAEGVDPQLIE